MLYRYCFVKNNEKHVLERVVTSFTYKQHHTTQCLSRILLFSPAHPFAPATSQHNTSLVETNGGPGCPGCPA